MSLKPHKYFKFCLFSFFALQVIFAGYQEDSIRASRFAAAGQELMERQKPDSSNLMYLRSIEIWDSLGIWKENVRCRLKIVVNAIYRSDYTYAMEMLSVSEMIAKKNGSEYSEEMGRIYTYKSFIHSATEDPALGVQMILRAIECFERSVGLENENAGWAFYTLANAYNRTGEYEKSLEAILRSKSILTSLLDENHINLSKLYIALGLFYDAKNDFDEAITSTTMALKILQHHNRLLSHEAGYCYLNLMSTYNNIGDYAIALEYGAKALDLYSRLAMMDHPQVGGAYAMIGKAYTATGDYENAKLYLQKAIDFNSNLNITSSIDAGYKYRDMAVVLNKIGEKKKAVDYAIMGIEKLRKVFNEFHPQMGFIYELTAEIYSSQNAFDKALHYYTKAVTARRNIGPSRSWNDIAVLYSSIAEIYLRTNSIDSASLYLQMATAVETESHQKIVRQHALLTRRYGDLYRLRKKHDDALREYHHAALVLTGEPKSDDAVSLPDHQKSIYKIELLELFSLKAAVFYERFSVSKNISDLQNSYAHYRSSLDLIDELRRQYNGDGSKMLLAEKEGVVYGEACRLALELHAKTKESRYKEEAFLIADRSKANILLEKLLEGDAKHFAGIPDSLLEQEKELLKTIAYLDIQIQKNDELNGTNEDIEPLNDRKFNLQSRHKQLLRIFETKYPEYFDLKFARPPLSINDIRSAIKPGSLIIEYLVHNNRLYIFTLTNKDLDVNIVSNTGSLAASVEAFSNSLRRYDDAEYRRTSTILYTMVLKPIGPRLRRADNVIVIPDGPLHTVPFEALPLQPLTERDNDFTKINFAIRSFDMSYSYSAAFYIAKQEQLRKTGSDRVSFAGFAPVFRDSTNNGDFLANRSFAEQSGLSDVRSITLDGKKFNELKYSEDEIDAISHSFNNMALPHREFLHTNATETNFKRFCGDYSIVHVATHGFINEKNPTLSALLFSQPGATSVEDDGILYVHETFNLDLNADLIVLSSCESGVGKIIQGEGMMALTRGLFYSGARNIIYSLWKVSDKQTYLLMNTFYTNLLNGQSYSSSLRNAKLALIASKESAFPAKWSGFVLMGK